MGGFYILSLFLTPGFIKALERERLSTVIKHIWPAEAGCADRILCSSRLNSFCEHSGYTLLIVMYFGKVFGAVDSIHKELSCAGKFT